MPFKQRKQVRTATKAMPYSRLGTLHPFNPLDLRDNMMAWWDFNRQRDIRYSSSTLISHCYDQSPQGRNLSMATASYQPDHIAMLPPSTGYYYRRCAEFNGSDNMMRCAHGNTWDGTGIAGSQNRTMVATVQLDTDAGGSNAWLVSYGNASATNYTRWQWGHDTNLRLRLQIVTGYIVGTTVLPVNAARVVSVALDGTKLSQAVLRVNGVQEAISDDNDTAQNLNTIVGDKVGVGAGHVNYAPPSAGQYQGIIKDLLIFDAALTDRDLLMVERFVGQQMRIDTA